MKIGRKLRGGEAIELIGDLGAGKTAFVSGLARGMGSRDAVSSPSFALSNRYRGAKLNLYHFDFHRLDDPGIMRRELAEVLEDSEASVAVEWADNVRDVMPKERLTINMTATGENSRRLDFSYPNGLKYLIPKQ